MQRVYIKYNPYKMKTEIVVNGTNVCESDDYLQFREFIETNTPLQKWVESIPYKNWKGLINELATEECYDKIEITFDGRKIDYEDLVRACNTANSKRDIELSITYKMGQEYSDAKLAQNIDGVMQTLLSEKFAKLVEECGDNSQIAKDYKNLPYEYQQTKDKEFKIVFAGLYSSGKSTILNALIRHNILPTSDETCTAKVCKIKHDKKLKDKITLECFDKQGEVVVPKETFDNDDDCLKRFWEITPLDALESNPATVDTIEISLDLSHLYPNKEMEKAFNLVIVDTPGTNSIKTKGEERGKDEEISKKLEEALNLEEMLNDNKDLRIAIDAINNGSKEMVVICSSAQDYQNDRIGFLLKVINATAQEEKGEFNDRFLFVLNKCDLLIYNNNESIYDKKRKYISYLTNAQKLGLKDNSPIFVPNIFMISAYVQLAIQKGVNSFTKEERQADKFKKNLYKFYKPFATSVFEDEDENYYLSNVCDVAENVRNDLQSIFNQSIDQGDEVTAVEVQTGMQCIEMAIKDYIARYAYPFKVRELVETFDALLQSVNSLNDFEDKKLKERLEDLGKGISARGEVKKAKEEQERIKEKLALLEESINIQKDNINAITFERNKIVKIRENMEVRIESKTEVKKIRNSVRDNTKFLKHEIDSLVNSVDNIFTEELNKAETEFEITTRFYSEKLEEICKYLKAISEELQNEDEYNFNGFNFSRTLGVEKLNRMDISLLRKHVEKEKETVTEIKERIVPNPIKEEKYEWWQLIKKIKQVCASEYKVEYIEVEKNYYDAKPLQTYLDNTLAAFRTHCSNTANNYVNDINEMKKQAIKMADEIPEDIKMTADRISEFVDKINTYGDDINALKEEMAKINEKKELLQGLIEAIEVGGRSYV